MAEPSTIPGTALKLINRAAEPWNREAVVSWAADPHAHETRAGPYYLRFEAADDETWWSLISVEFSQLSSGDLPPTLRLDTPDPHPLPFHPDPYVTHHAKFDLRSTGDFPDYAYGGGGRDDPLLGSHGYWAMVDACLLKPSVIAWARKFLAHLWGPPAT